ncbi:MAG TPA: sugar phosphate isomerase/epimerase [Candidatus Limnocylindrales bacterium]|jgi:sugar phosphate isomerase/epimerase|nr:sugar phosphate isomerase/epimerase [Candidatus Limnocylindrales bacterium]
MKIDFHLPRSAALLVLLSSFSAKAATVGTGPSFKGPVGLQLYSLREQFKKDVPSTLDEVKKWGITYAELATTYDLPPEKFKQELNARGIEAISAHFAYERYRDDAESIAKEAKALGLKYAGCAWISHQGDFDEKTCREAIAVFNKAGEVMAKNGIKFFYHVHGYEFQPYQKETLLDLLIKETKPELVSYEMDIFWIVFPGRDPVKLLETYGKRWELAHLKDMRKGTKTGSLSGHTEVENDAALGQGLMDLPAILRAAEKVGIKWYFIEDESPWSEQQIPQSLKYLEQVKF